MNNITTPPFFQSQPKKLGFPIVELHRGWDEARERLMEIPACAGLYVLVRPATDPATLPCVAYVGKSEQLRTRWMQHLSADTTRLLLGTRTAAGHQRTGAVLHQTYMNEFLRRDMELWLWPNLCPEVQESLFIRAHVRAHGHRPLHNNTIPEVGESYVLRFLDEATEWMTNRCLGLM